MITLKDIAEVAGVSISTVSRVMNNKSTISEDTKKRILSAAQELKFKQGIVSQINTERTFTIGIIIPQKGEYYHNDPHTSPDIRSLLGAFDHAGHKVHIFHYNEAQTQPDSFIGKLVDKGVEGILLSDPLTDTRLPDNLMAAAIPFVVTNGIYDSNEFFQIDFDNYNGMRKIFSLVLEKGHRDIGIISGPLDHLVTRNRLDAIQDELNERGIGLDKSCYRSGPFSLESGFALAGDLLKEKPDLTVLVCLSDYIAMGAIKSALEMGYSVPDKLSVTGFDDIEMASYMNPPLTTVHRFDPDAAILIAQALIQAIEYGAYISNGRVLLKTPVIERVSLKSY